MNNYSSRNGELRMRSAVQTLINSRLPTIKLYRSTASRGFTLLELLVVVAIIGLLAAYVGPKYFAQVGKSERSVAKAQIVSFSKALGAYRLDVGEFPTTEQGLNALMLRPTDNATKWNGPYLEKAIPLDPWGHPYVYRAPGTDNDFDLVSYGKDGQPGGNGDSSDITSY